MEKKLITKEIPENLKDKAEEYRQKMVESIVEFDDSLTEKFLNEEEIALEDLYRVAHKATCRFKNHFGFYGFCL